jgi:hypothetical protein
MTFLSVMAQNGGVLKISDTVLAKKKACGESAAVNDEDCESWKSNVLPGLLENYEERNVFSTLTKRVFFLDAFRTKRLLSKMRNVMAGNTVRKE